jgi:hypothetical protein
VLLGFLHLEDAAKTLPNRKQPQTNKNQTKHEETPATQQHVQPQRMPNSKVSTVAMFKVIACAMDRAMTKKMRPLKQVFIFPTMPIRENYMYRFLVNLVWFARDYLVLILLTTFISSFFYPGFIISLMATIRVHTAASYRGIWRLVQLAAVSYNVWFYGFLPGGLLIVALTMVVCSHAIMIPYTDDASAAYDRLMKGQADAEEYAAPRTPVVEYVAAGETGKFPSVVSLDEIYESSSSSQQQLLASGDDSEDDDLGSPLMFGGDAAHFIDGPVQQMTPRGAVQQPQKTQVTRRRAQSGLSGKWQGPGEAVTASSLPHDTMSELQDARSFKRKPAENPIAVT